MLRLFGMEINIYTDGSCKGNPGPGGWAAILIMEKQEIAIKGGEDHTTNNRMEMMAIIKALEYVRHNAGVAEENFSQIKIKIHSDSNLIIQTLLQNWKRKKNTDLWAEMDKARAWLKIDWIWVKGHADNLYNNKVDELAQKEADKHK